MFPAGLLGLLPPQHISPTRNWCSQSGRGAAVPPNWTSDNTQQSVPHDSGSSRSVKYREAGFEDYQQIAAVQSRNGLEPKPLEEWRHFWVDNPVYEKVGKDWPIGWVAENERKAIVGHIGNVPLSYEFKGRTI